MKIYSELTKEFYESVPACEKAEKEFKKQQEQLETEKAIREQNISKEKKELSKAIETAEEKLKAANTFYDAAKQKAADILEKSNKEVKEILDEAEDVVKKAQQQKLDAVIAFNKKFGAYTTTVTGEKAAEEFNRVFNTAFNKTSDLLSMLVHNLCF